MVWNVLSNNLGTLSGHLSLLYVFVSKFLEIWAWLFKTNDVNVKISDVNILNLLIFFV